MNDADRLALDPVMRQVVGGRAVDAQAASASQMGRFETETLALPQNLDALADLNGQWIDRLHDRNGLKFIVLDMDSSVSPTHGDQKGACRVALKPALPHFVWRNYPETGKFRRDSREF